MRVAHTVLINYHQATTLDICDRGRKMEIMVLENGIKLIPMTSELFHKVRMNYIADPMMSDHQYLYNKDSVKKEFEKKVMTKTENGL